MRLICFFFLNRFCENDVILIVMKVFLELRFYDYLISFKIKFWDLLGIGILSNFNVEMFFVRV